MSDQWWEALGIEPTESERDIKRAYARKLRDTRPDEDPQAFQELHHAYKMALLVAANNFFDDYNNKEDVPVESETGEQDREIHGALHAVEPLPIAFAPSTDAIALDPLSFEQQEEIKVAVAQLDKMLRSPHRHHNPDNWDFLIGSSSLLDDNYRVALGSTVIARIIEHNNQMSGGKARRNSISPNVLALLDDYFFWTSAPHLFMAEAEFEQAYQLIGDIDSGRKRALTHPVGGEVIMSTDDHREADLNSRRPSSTYEFSPWQLIALFLLGSQIVRMLMSS